MGFVVSQNALKTLGICGVRTQEFWVSPFTRTLILTRTLGDPNSKPKESSRNMLEYAHHGQYIPIISLLYSWASHPKPYKP